MNAKVNFLLQPYESYIIVEPNFVIIIAWVNIFIRRVMIYNCPIIEMIIIKIKVRIKLMVNLFRRFLIILIYGVLLGVKLKKQPYGESAEHCGCCN